LCFLFVFALAAPNLYASRCSNASLNGTYGYSSQGFVEVTPDINTTGFVPFAQSGIISYDGAGKLVAGTFTYSTTTANGGSFKGTFTGSYKVHSNCTGKVEVDLTDGTIFHFDLVVLGPGLHTYLNTDPTGFLGVYTMRVIAEE
jgi:hypothetical protein